jgi:hypothetical protein
MNRFLNEKIKSIPELVALLIERTGKTQEYIEKAMQTKEGFKELIAIFQRGHLQDTALSTRSVAGTLDKNLVAKYGQEKARDDVKNIKEITDKLNAG